MLNTPTADEILSKWGLLSSELNEWMKQDIIKAMEEYASIVAREASEGMWNHCREQGLFSNILIATNEMKTYLDTHHPLKP